MINSFKRLAPLGKTMAYMCVMFAIATICVPIYKSEPIDFEAVLVISVGGVFWWLLGRWYENETKDPYS